MRKKTMYKVTGISETKPDNLPKGLEVEAFMALADPEILKIRGITFQDSITETNGVFIKEDRGENHRRHMSKEETRKIRDFLNKILDESTKVRVLRDQEGDVWFELSPGKFALGGSEGDTTALANAKRKVANETGNHNWTFDEINSHGYLGPAKFIENTWE